jgi:hypothetical protein
MTQVERTLSEFSDLLQRAIAGIEDYLSSRSATELAL